MEQRAKKEVEQQLTAVEAAILKTTAEQQVVDPSEVVQAGIVAIFGCKAMKATLAAGATMVRAMEAEEKAAAEA